MLDAQVVRDDEEVKVSPSRPSRSGSTRRRCVGCRACSGALVGGGHLRLDLFAVARADRLQDERASTLPVPGMLSSIDGMAVLA